MATITRLPLLPLLLLASAPASSLAALINVGGDQGWVYNVAATWTPPRVHVGDRLNFTYDPSSGTVHDEWLLTGQSAYDSCDFSGATFLGNNLYITAPFTAPGVYYYACSIPGHCLLLQKVIITVDNAPRAAAPSTSPAITLLPPPVLNSPRPPVPMTSPPVPAPLSTSTASFAPLSPPPPSGTVSLQTGAAHQAVVLLLGVAALLAL